MVCSHLIYRYSLHRCEEEIEKICIQNGLNIKVSETVYLYLTNSKDDVADILGVEGTTVIRRLKKFIKKTTN